MTATDLWSAVAGYATLLRAPTIATSRLRRGFIRVNAEHSGAADRWGGIIAAPPLSWHDASASGDGGQIPGLGGRVPVKFIHAAGVAGRPTWASDRLTGEPVAPVPRRGPTSAVPQLISVIVQPKAPRRRGVARSSRGPTASGRTDGR
ncbi:hypothetical protein JCM9957A_57620 [Kineosporia succinea]